MSDAIGAVRFEADGLIVFFEYQGSVDLAYSKLWATEDEVCDHWRQYTGETCRCEGEPVTVCTIYGGGFWWQALACRKCMEITGPNRDPFECGDEDSRRRMRGLPEWAPADWKESVK